MNPTEKCYVLIIISNLFGGLPYIDNYRYRYQHWLRSRMHAKQTCRYVNLKRCHDLKQVLEGHITGFTLTCHPDGGLFISHSLWIDSPNKTISLRSHELAAWQIQTQFLCSLQGLAPKNGCTPIYCQNKVPSEVWIHWFHNVSHFFKVTSILRR